MWTRKKKGAKHSPLKHMLICCGLPILIILSLPFIGKCSPVIATLLGTIAPFICPIMMGGMMYKGIRIRSYWDANRQKFCRTT
ncbi:hypothetical protein [Clostridium sp. Marseille-P299]|uniref:hypothetical protein n=1 Tax=Clostridium sp. Marseille-P299 TaxID=1805477 RepID=UPI000831FBD0|nr:hypothetical protein [Clostridium sp. Marseille-P299]